MRIAVIGSGISGLGAAYLTHFDNQVTLYEVDDRIGGIQIQLMLFFLIRPFRSTRGLLFTTHIITQILLDCLTIWALIRWKQICRFQFH